MPKEHLKKYAKFFQPQIVSRGDDLADFGAVQLIAKNDSAILAHVDSETSNKVYENVCCITVNGGTQKGLLMHCGCPYHLECADLCKHNWAVLKELDDVGVLPRNIDTISRALNSGLSLNTLLGSLSEISTSSPIKTPQKQQEAWRKKLKLFQNTSALAEKRQGPSTNPFVVNGENNDQEIYLKIQIPDTRDFIFESDGLDLLLMQRKRNPNGKWSKLKKISSYSIVSLWFDIQSQGDRRLLKHFERFLGGENRPSSSYYSSYGRIDRFFFHRSFLPHAMRYLVKNGAKILLENGPRMLDPYNLISSIEKAELKTHIESNSNGFAFNASLHTQNESIDLRRLDLFFVESGIAIMANRLIEFPPCEKHPDFYESCFVHGSLELPKTASNEAKDYIKQHLDVQSLELPDELAIATKIITPECHLRMEAASENWHFEIIFEYQEEEHSPLSHVPLRQDADEILVKDTKREKELLNKLQTIPKIEYHPATHSFDCADSDLNDVLQALAALKIDCFYKKQKVLSESSTPFASLSSESDWLELKGNFEFQNHSLSIPDILKAAAKAQNGLIPLVDGQIGFVDQKKLQRLQLLSSFSHDSKNKKDQLMLFHKTQASLVGLLTEDFKLDASSTQVIKRFNRSASLRPIKASKQFQGILRPYQEEGLSWLNYLEKAGFGGCLADDMGLGKTIQVLALLQRRKILRKNLSVPTLLVVPKSLLYNWVKEAERFTPNISILTYEGADRRDLVKDFHKHDIIIMTYALLRSDINDGTLSDIEFDYAILDEAQNIKNENSQVTRSALDIKAQHRLALTGTPLENHIGELFSILRFLNPAFFNKRIASYKSVNDTQTQILVQSVRPFLLRRKKEDVLKELPPKQESVLYCDLQAKQKKEYDTLKKYYQSKISMQVKAHGLNNSKMHILEALTRLRQAACHTGLIAPTQVDWPSGKIDTLMEQLTVLLEEGQKVLVFSQFTKFLKIVESQLNKRGIDFSYLDGKTRNRETVINQFKEAKGAHVFLISLKAGGVGLNLTEATYAMILDPWWNPAVEAQAIDRIHRIGQSKPVHAFRLISRDTVEEKILSLQATKRKLYDDVINQESGMMRKITLDDVNYLLS